MTPFDRCLALVCFDAAAAAPLIRPLRESPYGNQSTPSASVFFSGKTADWGASLAAEIFNTDGYVPVSPAERGPVDTPAASRHSVVSITTQTRFGDSKHVFGAISFFGES